MQTFNFFFFISSSFCPQLLSLGLPPYIPTILPTNHIAKIFSPTNHKFSKQKLLNSDTKCGLRGGDWLAREARTSTKFGEGDGDH